MLTRSFRVAATAACATPTSASPFASSRPLVFSPCRLRSPHGRVVTCFRSFGLAQPFLPDEDMCMQDTGLTVRATDPTLAPPSLFSDSRTVFKPFTSFVDRNADVAQRFGFYVRLAARLHQLCARPPQGEPFIRSCPPRSSWQVRSTIDCGLGLLPTLRQVWGRVARNGTDHRRPGVPGHVIRSTLIHFAVRTPFQHLVLAVGCD